MSGLGELVPRNARMFAAGVIVVAAAAISAWALWPHPPALEAGPAATDETTAAADETSGSEVERLRLSLPAGFVDESCRPEPASPPATAELICSTNADAAGPASARFLLAKDTADLQGLVRSTLLGAQVVTCPGNIQSPGPWRRNATPTLVAGTLICAAHGDRSAIAWTTDAQHLVSIIEADAEGASLAQLYTWWASHS
jgi:serine/threonine kinase PknH